MTGLSSCWASGLKALHPAIADPASSGCLMRSREGGVVAHHPTSLRRSVRLTVAASLVLALMPALQAATAPAAQAATTGSIDLTVLSARSVNNGAGFVHKGDKVTDYKWMINVDDTGDPGTLANQGTATCLPGGATYDADKCPWPSTRTTDGTAAIVA